jgi:intracellular multiplication protein IcmL
MDTKDTKPNQKMIDDNINFCQRYRYIIMGIVLFSILAIFLTGGLIYMSVVKQKPKYYATTTAGDIVPLQTLSEPVISDNYLVQWSALTVRALFNLDFVHLQDNLENAKKYFTGNGWNAFIAALDKSGLSELIRDKKLMTSAVITQTPAILSKAVMAGRYSWVVQMPVLVTYTSASMTARKALIATIMVRRVPVLGASQGVLITDIALQPDITGSNNNNRLKI